MKFSFKRIWDNKFVVFYLFHSLYFNLKYLPFKQAIRMPILLYKPKFYRMLKGKVRIETNDHIRPAMIILGGNFAPLCPFSGVLIENNGGEIVFKGSCFIGNDSSICVGKKGKLVFGKNFRCSGGLKIECTKEIEFGDYNLIGWNTTFIDTDFHILTKIDGSGRTKGYGPIHTGSNCWFGSKCLILKNTTINNFTTISAGSIISGKCDFPEYSVIGNRRTVEVLRSGVYRDPKNDSIIYE